MGRRVLAGIAIVWIVVAACGSSTSSTPPEAPIDPTGAAGEPIIVSNQRDGVVVTLTASSGRIEAGEPLQLRVDILNATLETISWQSGGCELLNGFAVEGEPIAQPPAGIVWPDAAGLAKWSATTGGVALEWIHSPGVPEGVSFGCHLDLFYDDIDPGHTISADAIWSAKSSDGVPAPPGAYRVTYGFPFVGRGSVAQLGNDPPASRPIKVDLPITVEGEDFLGIPSTMAIDAAFSDPGVAAWVHQHLRKFRLNGAEIRLVEGRWRFTIQLAEDRKTIVVVDPANSRVVDVRLAD